MRHNLHNKTLQILFVFLVDEPPSDYLPDAPDSKKHITPRFRVKYLLLAQKKCFLRGATFHRLLEELGATQAELGASQGGLRPQAGLQVWWLACSIAMLAYLSCDSFAGLRVDQLELWWRDEGSSIMDVHRGTFSPQMHARMHSIREDLGGGRESSEDVEGARGEGHRGPGQRGMGESPLSDETLQQQIYRAISEIQYEESLQSSEKQVGIALCQLDIPSINTRASSHPQPPGHTRGQKGHDTGNNWGQHTDPSSPTFVHFLHVCQEYPRFLAAMNTLSRGEYTRMQPAIDWALDVHHYLLDAWWPDIADYCNANPPFLQIINCFVSRAIEWNAKHIGSSFCMPPSTK